MAKTLENASANSEPPAPRAIFTSNPLRGLDWLLDLWVARGVLLILLFFSIVSWAMILQKLGLFSRIRGQSDQFLRIFRASHGVANPQALAAAISPFSSVYLAGYRELQRQVGGSSGNPHPPKLKSLQAVTVSMQLASAEEVRRVEKGMSWLATTMEPKLKIYLHTAQASCPGTWFRNQSKC